MSLLQRKLDSEVLHFWEQVDMWLEDILLTNATDYKKGQPALLILLPDYFQTLLNRFAALLNYSSILACLFVLCKKSKHEDLCTEFIA